MSEWILYKATNKRNDKVYIGQTKCTLRKRQSGHKHKRSQTLFSKAVRKYGIDGFLWDVLATAKTLEDANELEEKFIKDYKSHITFGGYNLKYGGDNHSGFRHTEIAKRKISEAHKGNEYSKGKPSWNKGMKGKLWSYGTEKRRVSLIRESLKGNKRACGNRNQRKSVRCIETGEIFPSAYHARESIDGKFERSDISSVCKGRRKKCFGFTWEFVNEHD